MRMKDVLAVKPQILIKLCKGVDKIVEPLTEAFNITFFSYKRIKSDGEFIFLTNHYPWLRHCIDKQYIQYLNAYRPPQDKLLWDGIEEEASIRFIIQDAKENFNISHGLTIVKHTEDYDEHYNFATTADNSGINNFYFNSSQLLEHFILYFRDKAARLIQVVENYSVNLKDIVLIKRQISKQEFYADIDYYIENTNLKTIHLNINNRLIEVNFTLAKCGYLLTQGYSYKQIAKRMYVSVKTIEARLAKLRQLLNVSNKKELIQLLSQKDALKALSLAFIKSTTV